MATLADRIDALLPQTQCTRCGFADCRAYAQALAEGGTTPDRCPPGGDEGAARLAALVGRGPATVDRACGEPGAILVAVIDEPACIGCVKCILACPVDAIVGGAKKMHTVIASWCTGCELCVPPCPVDCIRMEPAPALPPADHSRDRHAFRAFRLARDERERAERLEALE